jgi:integrase
LKHHSLPAFGEKRLDEIKRHPIEVFKAELIEKGKGRKWINNILACLGKMLRYANEIELIEVVPRIKLLKVEPTKFDFLTFDEYTRLVDAAKDDPTRNTIVLTGGDAGLRRLRGGNAHGSALVLARNRGFAQERARAEDPAYATARGGLEDASASSKRIGFLSHRRKPVHPVAIEAALRYACKRAGLRRIGSHVLRHTFCSHLAMLAAAPKAVQELAGHSTLTMTLRYMHLAPSALREAIELLNYGQPVGNDGKPERGMSETRRDYQRRGRDSNPR